MAASAPLPDERSTPDGVEWSPSALAHWARIQSHDLDVSGDALPFTTRLARDNHWSADYARRVVDEYKRFCFLACVADHPVTPSDQVDQAWHLHLLYTEDYWTVFCPDVLGRALHHGPTRGGAAEGSRFDDQYARTRHSYRRWFGQHAPVDIWPIATERFGRDTRYTRANRDDYWLVPRPQGIWRRVRARLRRTPLLFLFLFMLLGPAAGIAEARSSADDRPTTLADAGYDPYALAAKPFLVFFAGACAAVACAATVSSFGRSRAHGAGRGLGVDADLYTTAVLAGGESRAVVTALTRLVSDGHLSIGSSGNVFVHEPPPEGSDGLDRVVYGVVERDRNVAVLRSPAGRLHTALERIVRDAERAGLLLPSDELPRFEMFVAALFPIALAAPRIALALPAGRPIGYLVAIILAFSLLGPWPVRAVRTRLTEGGRRVLDRLKERASASARPAGRLVGDELLWATAVLGTTVLAGTALGDVHAVARQQMSSGSTGGGWACGGSGCGGGGCGGGGCGGGGCGG